MSSDDITTTSQHRYSAALARDIESKWRRAWAEGGTFDVTARQTRGEITVDRQASQAEVTSAGLALEAVAKLVEGKEIIRVVVVPGKIVNFVIR